jgi:hypothetical protein
MVRVNFSGLADFLPDVFFKHEVSPDTVVTFAVSQRYGLSFSQFS